MTTIGQRLLARPSKNRHRPIRITEGTGKLVVNGRDFESYFSHREFWPSSLRAAPHVDLREKIDVSPMSPAAVSPDRLGRLPTALHGTAKN